MVDGTLFSFQNRFQHQLTRCWTYLDWETGGHRILTIMNRTENAHSAYSRVPRCLPNPHYPPSLPAHPALASSVTSPSNCLENLPCVRDSGLVLPLFDWQILLPKFSIALPKRSPSNTVQKIKYTYQQLSKLRNSQQLPNHFSQPATSNIKQQKVPRLDFRLAIGQTLRSHFFVHLSSTTCISILNHFSFKYCTFWAIS